MSGTTWDPRSQGNQQTQQFIPNQGQQFNPGQQQTGMVPQGGFQGQPGGYPTGYQPQPQQQQQPEVDLTQDVSLNDDLEFETLSALPDQGMNESARFCFLLFDAKGDMRMRKALMFYPQVGGKRHPFLAPAETDPLFASCVKRFDAPKVRLGAIVLAYHVDREGNFIPTVDGAFKFKLHSLTANELQSTWFRTNHRRRSFRTHDLMRTATKVTQQYGAEYAFSVEDQNVFMSTPPETQQLIIERATLLHERYLGPRLGRPRPSSEIEDLLRDIDPSIRRGQASGSAGGQQQSNGVWNGSPHGGGMPNQWMPQGHQQLQQPQPQFHTPPGQMPMGMAPGFVPPGQMTGEFSRPFSEATHHNPIQPNGQMMPGQPMGGLPMGGLPMGGQSIPGQQMGGQQMGGDQVPQQNQQTQQTQQTVQGAQPMQQQNTQTGQPQQQQPQQEQQGQQPIQGQGQSHMTQGQPADGYTTSQHVG